MNIVDPEYVLARKVLLDALQALGPQARSAILVGAQAIYQHTGTVESTGVAMTTDGDLALDTDLLASDPELADALRTAGFVSDKQPGSWVGEAGVKVDLMVVPHQAGRTKPTARAASIPPHDKRVARITRGLEPALVDHQAMRIVALDPSDDRELELEVAGPAALVVAKLIKIQERQDQLAAGTGRGQRIKGKDAVDIFRLLLTVPLEELIAGFRAHKLDEQAQAVSRTALDYLALQHERGTEGHLVAMLAGELPDDPVVSAQFDALVDELLESLS